MIDQSYVSGLSITYSNNPRKHIWTFASGFSERYDIAWNCPCSIYPGNDPPSFVGNNYYCESGSVDYPDTGTLMTHYGMEQDVHQAHVVTTLPNLGSIVN